MCRASIQGPSEASAHRFWGGFPAPRVSRGLRGPGPPGASRGLQGSPGAFRGLHGSRSYSRPFRPDFGGVPGRPPCSRPSPADLLQLGARTLPGGPPGDSAGDGRGLGTLGLGYSHQGENQCTLYIFGLLGWLEAGLCLPMYGKSPEGLYTSILHKLL